MMISESIEKVFDLSSAEDLFLVVIIVVVSH
jgi:hypothetical protein